jgi:hypothetical protein
MKSLYLIILLPLLIFSCGDDSFKKVEALGNFRLLGILADSPEVDPNGDRFVDVQVLVSDIEGGGRTIQGTVQTCIDPGISFGAQVSCDHDPTSIPVNYDIDFQNDAGLGAANLYTGLTNILPVNVPANILNGRNSRDQFNGVGYIVIFKFTVDGKEEKAFKRIVGTNRGALNQNPVISDLLLNGSTILAFPTNGDDLLLTSNAPETYSYQTSDNVTEVRTEALQVAWYTSQGEFTLAKTNIDESTKYDSNPTSGASLVMAIVRDERGGMSFIIKRFP